jgi:pimeloyl-ACP methyl ester carboxylesterase
MLTIYQTETAMTIAARPTAFVAPAHAGVRRASVVSRDGTAIGYRQLGAGPGAVLVHGTMSSGYNHMQLAKAMADAFTVYVPDRRGRGLSAPYHADGGLQAEVEDLEALLTKTGAHNVFGVSSGGIICLEAARRLPAIHRAVVFEPPLFADRAWPVALLTRFDKQIAAGRVAAALVAAMKGSEMGPALIRALPSWLLERLTSIAMAGEAKNAKGEYLPMRALAPTLHDDFQIVVESSGALDRFSAIPAEVLLLGGSKSPRYLRTALDRLASALPKAERVELPGLDHAASWNTDRGGQPGPVARELRRFFSAGTPRQGT